MLLVTKLVVYAISGEAAKAFPLRGRCPSGHTGADEVVSQSDKMEFNGCFAAYTSSVTFGDSCALLSTRSAALTARRAVIHCR